MGHSQSINWTTLLHNQWIKEEITGEDRKYIETNENKTHIPKFMRCSKNSAYGEIKGL